MLGTTEKWFERQEIWHSQQAFPNIMKSLQQVFYGSKANVISGQKPNITGKNHSMLRTYITQCENSVTNIGN